MYIIDLATGKYFANCFLHFEPLGPLDPEIDDEGRDPSIDIPPYLMHGSYWERTWKSQNPKGWKKVSRSILMVCDGWVVDPDPCNKHKPYEYM